MKKGELYLWISKEDLMRGRAVTKPRPVQRTPSTAASDSPNNNSAAAKPALERFLHFLTIRSHSVCLFLCSDKRGWTGFVYLLSCGEIMILFRNTSVANLSSSKSDTSVSSSSGEMRKCSSDSSLVVSFLIACDLFFASMYAIT